VLHDREDIVTAFRVDAGSGELTQVQTLGVKNPAAVAVERTGRFLYMASPGNDALFAYRISQGDGRLTHVATEMLAQPGPVSVTVDPTNRFVYATSIAAGRVTRLTINPATGVLVEGPSLAVAGRPAAFAVAHPTERFVYVPVSPTTGNDGLQGFGIDAATGALALVDELVLNDPLTEVTLEPTGRFVYVLNHNSDAIQTFRIDQSSGQLTSIQTLVVSALGGLGSGLTAEATGRFLYVTCRCTATNSPIRAFRINATSGLLTDLGGTGGAGTFTVTASATDLAGRFLYMARVNGGGIEAFAINQTTGLLTALGATPYSSAAGELVMDPLGRFLYVANQNGFVDAFRVSAVTGALTSSGASFLLESGMRGASIDRTGRFFYPVTRGTGGSVHVFAIDPVNGDLEASGVPAVFLGNSDVGESAAVDATGRFLHVGHGTTLKGIRTFEINHRPAPSPQRVTSRHRSRPSASARAAPCDSREGGSARRLEVVPLDVGGDAAADQRAIAERVPPVQTAPHPRVADLGQQLEQVAVASLDPDQRRHRRLRRRQRPVDADGPEERGDAGDHGGRPGAGPGRVRAGDDRVGRRGVDDREQACGVADAQPLALRQCRQVAGPVHVRVLGPERGDVSLLGRALQAGGAATAPDPGEVARAGLGPERVRAGRPECAGVFQRERRDAAQMPVSGLRRVGEPVVGAQRQHRFGRLLADADAFGDAVPGRKAGEIRRVGLIECG
jgi:6-phosphogluconolactonase (cycloisomerase 2 family)